MTLTFQHKLALENGSVLLYHEGQLQSGESFHVLILVPGSNMEAYFQYIARREDFPVKELQSYGEILHCDIGRMSDEEIEHCLDDLQ